MLGIINLLNKLRNYNISKINDIQFDKPIFKIEKTKTYDNNIKNKNKPQMIPEWVDFIEILNKNNSIIDSNIESKKYNILNKNNNFDYTNYDLFEIYKYKYIHKDILSIGSYSVYDLKKELLSNDSLTNITNINLNSIQSLKKLDYDLLWIYGGFSLTNPINKDDRLEQNRLEKNLQKLEALKFLKHKGDMFYLISHLKIDATKEIVLLFSYLFESIVLIKPLLYNIISPSIYIYATNFDKEKYKNISQKINISNFKDDNISIISSLGIKSSNKNKIFDEINIYSNYLEKVIDSSLKLKIKKADEITMISHIAYSIGIPILPNYLNKKYEPYMDLYNLCSSKNLINIKTESLKNLEIANEVLQIYLKNQRFGTIDTEYNDFINYDLIIIDKFGKLDSLINKLGMNKYLYFINTSQNSYEILNQVRTNILEVVSKNIYKKIGYLSTLHDIKIKYNNFNIEIYDNKKYTNDIIPKLIPFVEYNKDTKYKQYSILLNNKKLEIKEDHYNLYPFYPIYDKLNEKIYLNPIHVQMIDTSTKIDIFNTIKENIKILLTSDNLKVENLNYQKRLIRGNIINIKVNHDPVPYYESNHGWLSDGTKSNLYTILKLFKLNTIFEFGTWYGNSTEYIKKHNPNCHLTTVDFFQSIIESEYTIRGVGVDKFYFKYPRLESVYKKMQKYKNVELIKGDAFVGYDYLLKKTNKPDMIFIDFIKSRNILFNFLFKISTDYTNTIIIGDDYVAQGVKLAVSDFIKENQLKYILITNNNSYILVPIHLYKKEIEIVMNEKNNEYMRKERQDLYFLCSNEIKKGNFKKAINMVLDNNLNLNLINKYIPNQGTLYHIFGFYLRNHEKKDSYLSILYDIEKPKDILNDYEFTFKDILRYDSSRLI